MHRYSKSISKSKFRPRLGILLTAILTPAAVIAEGTTLLPNVLVTASRVDVPGVSVGSAHTVISGEELEASGTVYVADALRKIPGIAISKAGGFGETTQIRMRGAEGNHTLLLIDGIEASNPVEGEYDLTSMLVRNIERIEVLRGPQSAVWGSNAMAGVINIVTRSGESGMSAEFFGEGGSFSTANGSGSLYFGDERARAALSISHFITDGTNISSFGTEEDGDKNLTASFKGDIDITPIFNVDAVARYTTRDSEFDPQDFAFPATATNGLVIDGARETELEEKMGRIAGNLQLLDGRWTHKISAAFTDVQRETKASGAITGGTDGDREVYSYVTSFNFSTPSLASANHSLTGLIERKRETFRNTGPFANASQLALREREMLGYVGEYRLDFFDRLFLSAALRYDDNDDFDDVYTFRTTGAYMLKETDTRLHASVGRGVTNPTFFEQFGFTPSSFDGNPNLKPERSLGWDVGVEQSLWDKRLVVDVTYFHANLDDEILSTFDFTTFRSSVTNLSGSSKRRGVEVSVSAYPSQDLDVRASYSYVKSEDANGDREVRRPRHTGGLDLTYRFLQDRASANLGVTYNGRMEDFEFVASTPRTRVDLDAYTLVSLAFTYDISEQLQWTGRVENLLDDEYQEIFSYNAPGIAAYTGLRLRLED